MKQTQRKKPASLGRPQGNPSLGTKPLGKAPLQPCMLVCEVWEYFSCPGQMNSLSTWNTTLCVDPLSAKMKMNYVCCCLFHQRPQIQLWDTCKNNFFIESVNAYPCQAFEIHYHKPCLSLYGGFRISIYSQRDTQRISVTGSNCHIALWCQNQAFRSRSDS